jgi:hypothetical protein
MAGFASGLRAGIDEAARKMAEAQLAGDDYGAGAWRERLSYLRRVARRHGVELAPGPGPGGEACTTTAALPPGCGARAGRPARSTRKESG